jgi:hypothetical protein
MRRGGNVWFRKLVASTDSKSSFGLVKNAFSYLMYSSNYIGEKMLMIVLLEAWTRVVEETLI